MLFQISAMLLITALSVTLKRLVNLRLQRIQNLFLYLLQLVLHLNNDVLHLCLIALRARCIDFTTHFLCDETEFFANSMTTLFHCFMEVFEVVCQSLLLLVDVEFLDVVNQLLLKTVLVVVYLRNLLETIDNLFSNLWYTTLLERFNTLQKVSDIINLLSKLLL